MIGDGDYVILRKGDHMKVVQAKLNGRPFVMDRMKFRLDCIVGEAYGSQYEYDKRSNKLVKREQNVVVVEAAASEANSVADNRDLVSGNEQNQALGKDEILALKNDGKTGDELMSELIKNSSTFNQKTKFSQEKWIKKKKKRHMNVFTILRPCTRLIAEMYMNRDPSKICYMRYDTLAQILNNANVESSSKVLLVEQCQGLLTGAILDRLGDDGKLMQLFTQPNPMKGRPALEDFGFKVSLLKERLKLYPLNLLNEVKGFEHLVSKASEVKEPTSEKTVAQITSNSTTLENAQPGVDVSLKEDGEPLTKRLKTDGETATNPVGDLVRLPTESSGIKSANGPAADEDGKMLDMPVYLRERLTSKSYLEENQFDVLVIAVKTNPLPLIECLIDKLKLSRCFAVYHPFQQPLLDCFVKLRQRGGCINIRLTQTWLRDIQVLPERTHPAVNMSGTGGYLLTGIVVEK